MCHRIDTSKEEIMKRVMIAAAAVAAILISQGAIAKHKYQKQTNVPNNPAVAASEKIQSMSDCMTFCAAHKSKGHAADRALFGKQFGKEIGKKGAITDYNYDEYTKVQLNCSKRQGVCMCMQK